MIALLSLCKACWRLQTDGSVPLVDECSTQVVACGNFMVHAGTHSLNASFVLLAVCIHSLDSEKLCLFEMWSSNLCLFSSHRYCLFNGNIYPSIASLFILQGQLRSLSVSYEPSLIYSWL